MKGFVVRFCNFPHLLHETVILHFCTLCTVSFVKEVEGKRRGRPFIRVLRSFSLHQADDM
jgi:hypothetical protein